jgi:hypothetical protein
MNTWQMSNRATLKWPEGGGCARDTADVGHYSIHPLGRKDEHRQKQRKHRIVGKQALRDKVEAKKGKK